jgi:hypothetical protein
MKERYYGKTAMIVGVLFILATVTSLASVAFLGTTLDGADYILGMPDNTNNVLFAVIFETLLALSIIGYGVLLFPILKERFEALATAYVSILIVEAVLAIIGSVCLLLMLTMSHDYASGTLDVASSRVTGALLMALREWSILLGTLVLFGVGSLALNYLLYLSRIVPRWLSIWGIVGDVCVLSYGLMGIFGNATTDMMSASTLLAMPIAIQEMVFATWLIIKGFDKPKTAPATNWDGSQRATLEQTP